MSAGNVARQLARAPKAGFYQKTPIVQPAAAAQGALAAQGQTDLTHAFGTADGTVADVGGAFSQATLNDNFKEATTQLALAKTDIANLRTLVTQLRTDLVNLGLIKGSA